MINWMDGPDHYGVSQALLTQGVYADAFGINLTANAGPGGVGTVFDINGNVDARLRKVLPGTRQGVGVGQRIYTNALPFSNNDLMTLVQLNNIGNAPMTTLDVLSTGALRIKIWNTPGAGLPTTVFITDPVIVAQSWQHVEFFCDFGSPMKFRIGVDSITIYDTDAYAQPAGISDCAQYRVSVNTPGFSWKMRDLYSWDTTGTLNNSGMQGDRQVFTTYPTADTADTDWVPSAGASGWPLISNVPPDDTEFISANAPDLLSRFEFEDIDTDITSISAAMVVARLWKSDAGLATVKLEMKSGADTIQGAEKAISTGKVFYNSIFETDPATDLKWTPFGINNATAGLERVE